MFALQQAIYGPVERPLMCKECGFLQAQGTNLTSLLMDTYSGGVLTRRPGWLRFYF